MLFVANMWRAWSAPPEPTPLLPAVDDGVPTSTRDCPAVIPSAEDLPHAHVDFRATVRRYPRLAPKDHTADSFESWLRETGEVIDDIEEVGELHLDICRLMGWPLPGAAEPPKPATDVPDAGSAHGAMQDLPTRLQIERRRAAERFIEWVRFTHPHKQEFSQKELDAAYAEHCEAEDLVAISWKTLRSGLRDIGIKTRQPNVASSGGAKRYRPTVWFIEPLSTVDVLPWPDVPSQPVPQPKRAA